jgi:hypothetical protein
MVELISRRGGLDWIGSKMLIAGSSVSDGANLVDMLDCYDIPDMEIGKDQGESEWHFSIPDNEVIIKRIKIPPNQSLDRRKLALFELTCTLSDAADNYYLETVASDGKMEMLGIACRKKMVDEKIAFLTEKMAKPAGFRTRGLALTSGYLTYCRPAGGELIALLDISNGFVSYSFLHLRRPVMIGGLRFSDGDKSADGFDDSWLVDLVTVIQYQKLQLFNSGYSAPLSLIVIGGSGANDEAAGRIGEKMKTRTELPSFRSELFADGLHSQATPYLVALGLTAEL